MLLCVCSGVFVGVVGRVCEWVGVCGWWMQMVRVGDGRFNPCVVFGPGNSAGSMWFFDGCLGENF